MSPRMMVAAAVTAAAAVAVGVFAVGGGGSDAYAVRIGFDDAGGLVVNGDVKIGGVVAGRIQALDLTRDDRAVATVHLKANAAPIGRGASVRIRPVNLLGEKYVDLDVGDVRHPQPSGSLIPAQRTSAPVELDDVINILDPESRARLRILVNETGIAVGGRGTDLNATLARMPRALDDAQRLVASVSDTVQIDRLVTEGDRVLAAFNRGSGDLTEMVDSAARTLAVTSRLRADLGQTLEATPATLSQLRATLVRLAGTATQLEPAAVELRRTAGPLARTLRALPAFRTAAAPTLGTATAVAPNLLRLAVEATPTVRRLQPLSDDLVTFARALDPVSRTLDAQTNPLLRVMEGWARAIQLRDGAGHLFRTEMTIDDELLTTLLSQLRPAPTESRKRTVESAPAADRLTAAANASPSAPEAAAEPRTPANRPDPPTTPAPPTKDATAVLAPDGLVGRALTRLLDSLSGR